MDEVFRALADPTRRSLLDGLGAREREQLADLLRKLGLSLPPLP